MMTLTKGFLSVEQHAVYGGASEANYLGEDKLSSCSLGQSPALESMYMHLKALDYTICPSTSGPGL